MASTTAGARPDSRPSALPGTRILAVGAHADDVELGCGGTLARATREGLDVFVLTFSKHDPWFEGTTYRVEDEWHESLDRLGVRLRDRRLGDLLGCRDDDFQRRRAEILRTLEEVRDAFRPDLVLFHSGHDTNQDHRQVHDEVLRALKRHASLLCYEFPSNLLRFDAQAHLVLGEEDLAAKCDALACYRSLRTQWEERNRRYGLDTISYLDADALHALARHRGIQVGARLAESFEVLRLIAR